MSLPINRASNFRDTLVYEACLEFNSGTFVAYTATDCVVARTGSGAYTIKLPKAFPKLLGANCTNGGAATKVLDTTIATNGLVNVTITEPADTRKVFVQLVVPTTPFNQRVTV